MKRIQSLDILRGIAMLGLVFMHAFEKTGYQIMANIFNYPLGVVLSLGLILYFASWRGLFLIISGVGSAYSFQKAVDNGKSPHKLFINRCLWSIILFLQGMAIQIFWNPYNGFYGVFFGAKGMDVINLGGLQWSDAVQTIAVGLFLTSLTHYILVLTKARKKQWISLVVNLVIMIIIFGTTQVVIDGVLTHFGWTSLKSLYSAPVANFGDRLKWMFYAVLVGEQEPLFPYVATFFLGSAIGIFLTTPKATKKNVILYSLFLGGVIIIVSIIVGALMKFPFGFGILPEMWFLLLGTGIQVWVLMLFLWVFDYSKHAQQLTKYTKTVRKAGILSLTIFTLQALDYIPRLFLTVGSNLLYLAGWGEPMNFLSNGGSLNIGAAFLASFVVLFFWIGLIAIWEKINYALTFDWIFEILRELIAWQKINFSDPLLSKEIIFNPEIAFEVNIEKVIV
jgi:hypothetical protein